MFRQKLFYFFLKPKFVLKPNKSFTFQYLTSIIKFETLPKFRSRGLRKGFGPGSYSGEIPVKPGRRVPLHQSSNKAIGQTRNRMLENTSKETRSQLFPTNYRRFIQQLSSNVPSSLVRGITGIEEKKKDNPGVGKVRK